MTRLVSIEFRRILARRIVRMAAAAALLGMLIAGVVLFARSHRLSPSDAAALEQRARAQQEQILQDCVAHIPPDQVPSELTREEFCKQITQGAFEPQDPRFQLAHYRDIALGLAVLFIALLGILGASFAGAEWHAGTVAAQLTWEPRRIRLLTGKIIATAAFAFMAFLAAEIVLFGVVAPAGFFRGTAAGMTSSWFHGVVGILLRAAVVAALAAGAAHALASLARNTAAAVGAAFVYGAVLEPLVRQLRPGWQHWLFADNVATFVAGHAPAQLAAEARGVARGFVVHLPSVTRAGVLVSAYVLGLVVISLVVFRRRDVT